MTAEDRVQAVAEFGFTERQARFLVLVMRPRPSPASFMARRRVPFFGSSSAGGTRLRTRADTIVGGSITSITSDCTGPSVNRIARIADQCPPGASASG